MNDSPRQTRVKFSPSRLLSSWTISHPVSGYGRQKCIVERIAAIYRHHRGRERFDGLHCSLDAQLPGREVVSLGTLDHRTSQQIIGQQVAPDFLALSSTAQLWPNSGHIP